MNDELVTLQLTAAEIDIVLMGLGKLPLEHAYMPFQNIGKQRNTGLEKQKTADTPRPAKRGEGLTSDTSNLR